MNCLIISRYCSEEDLNVNFCKENPLKFCRVAGLDRLSSGGAHMAQNKLPPINSEAVEQYLSVPRLQQSYVSSVRFVLVKNLKLFENKQIVLHHWLK